jgi:hypothetical protein
MPSSMPSGMLAASLRPTPVEAPAVRTDDPKSGGCFTGWLMVDELEPLVFAGYLIAFFVGVAATIAWQSCVGTAGQATASAASLPDQQPPNAILLDTVRRSIDRLAAGQEKMTREINEMRAAQFVPYGNAEPSPRLAPAPVPNPVQRPSQAPAEADTGSGWRRQPCCQWPASSTR